MAARRAFSCASISATAAARSVPMTATNDWVPELLRVSVARTTKVLEPGAVGVPTTDPLGSTTVPAGLAPADSDHV